MKFSKDIREMEEKRKRLEVEVEIGKRRMRELKEEIEKSKKEREDLERRIRKLERLLEEGRKRETWIRKEEGKRMKSLIVRPGKDENGNNLLHFSESESEDSRKENEKNWKKLRAEKRSAGS